MCLNKVYSHLLHRFQNDRCTGATDLGSFSDGQSITVTNQSSIGATNDNTDNPYCQVSTEKGVWYKLNVAFPATVTVSTCNQSSFDTQIAIYSGACGSLVCEAGADDSSDCGRTTRAIDNVDSGDIYLRVDGWIGSMGTFNLTVSVSAIIQSLPPVSLWLWVTNFARRMTFAEC